MLGVVVIVFNLRLPLTVPQIADGGDLEPKTFGLTTKFNKMSEILTTTETPAIGNVLLCDVYPNWLYIELIGNKLLMHILKEYGTLNKEDYERVYKSYVLPYFTTWDNFSCCMNGDVQYSPVVLAWYAEKIGVKPTYPLRVMRRVAWSLRNIA